MKIEVGCNMNNILGNNKDVSMIIWW